MSGVSGGKCAMWGSQVWGVRCEVCARWATARTGRAHNIGAGVSGAEAVIIIPKLEGRENIKYKM